jgi:hypothetical protein
MASLSNQLSRYTVGGGGGGGGVTASVVVSLTGGGAVLFLAGGGGAATPGCGLAMTALTVGRRSRLTIGCLLLFPLV